MVERRSATVAANGDERDRPQHPIIEQGTPRFGDDAVAHREIFRPEDANASQVIFATGTSNIYGPVGFIKTENGLLKGTLCGTYNDDTSIVAKGRVRGGEWNRVELIWRVDTVELVLNGESNGCRPCVCPGRVGTAAWFGGRKSGGLFRGDLRNVRVSYE